MHVPEHLSRFRRPRATSAFIRAFAATLLLTLTACASRPPAPPLTFIVVRHAEKATDDPRDPSLSLVGRKRADALATSLVEAPLVAAYATEYRRTQQTAAPAASAHRIEVTRYDAKQDAGTFVARLRAEHRHGTVLVVGHSNTVPGIVAALCACAVAPTDESEYDHRFDVRIDARGHAQLNATRMP